MRASLAVAVACCLVLAGCGGTATGPAAQSPSPTPSPSVSASPTATPSPSPSETTPSTSPSTSTSTPTPESDDGTGGDAESTPPPAPPHPNFTDPATDRLGWEAGYWYDEPIAVDQSDGLNASEREAVVGRTMARVERIRRLEFTTSVPVTVQSRAAYRNESDDDGPAASAWNEQVWEALLLVGENRTVGEVLGPLYNGSVQGYYDTSADRIVLVSDSGNPTVDRQTLAHELTHALQDQHFGLDDAPSTQDGQLARNGLVEGDAAYVEKLYGERCGAEWSCFSRPASGPGGSLGDDMDVYVAVYQPYSDGPAFVNVLRKRGGWEAVNDAYDHPPTTTTQVIHPAKYPDWTRTEVTVADRSAANWHRFDHRPVADRVGEASLYATMWENGAVETFHLQQPTRPYRTYNYTHSTTAGWAGDAVVPYRSDDGEYGYVFRTEWETTGDAAEFAVAYRKALETRRGAERRGDGVLVVPAGPFADAFRVTRNGTTVTLVNAPTVDQLDAVHARPD